MTERSQRQEGVKEAPDLLLKQNDDDDHSQAHELPQNAAQQGHLERLDHLPQDEQSQNADEDVYRHRAADQAVELEDQKYHGGNVYQILETERDKSEHTA